jgi:uncharacterized protein (DUF1684 family)
MAVVPPPSGWAGQIAEGRAAKDREFKADPATPLLAEDVASFRGLDYWPPDPAYRYVGPIEAYEKPQRFTIVTTTGVERPCERYGRVTFTLKGERCTLQVYRLLDSEPQPGGSGLFLPFTDATTGKETYPAGRYIDLQGPEGGPFVMDFNRAYNPLCAYGAPERYRCPVTPAENRLPVRIESGERGFKRHAK